MFSTDILYEVSVLVIYILVCVQTSGRLLANTVLCVVFCDNYIRQCLVGFTASCVMNHGSKTKLGSVTFGLNYQHVPVQFPGLEKDDCSPRLSYLMPTMTTGQTRHSHQKPSNGLNLRRIGAHTYISQFDPFLTEQFVTSYSFRG